MQEHRRHHLHPVSIPDPKALTQSRPGGTGRNERGAGRQTDRHFLSIHHEPDVFTPFHTFGPGVRVGQEPRRAACALHPVHLVSASPLWPGIYHSASPRLRFPVKMSAFTQKLGRTLKLQCPPLFSLLLPFFPSFHSLLLSHQGLFLSLKY